MNGKQAKQKYKYRFDKSTQTLTKYFYDDRLFYELKIGTNPSDIEGTTEANASSQLKLCGSHLCIADTYEANYLFRNMELQLRDQKNAIKSLQSMKNVKTMKWLNWI